MGLALKNFLSVQLQKTINKFVEVLKRLHSETSLINWFELLKVFLKVFSAYILLFSKFFSETFMKIVCFFISTSYFKFGSILSLEN